MAEGRPRRGGELKRVVREVRIARAERNDVEVNVGEAEQALLERLGDALEGVFQELPQDHEQLLLGLLPGTPPRFWVDATSFVTIVADQRQYVFAKDTRLGRTVLAQSSDVETIADAVTRYVAERMVEREQVIEGDWVMQAIRLRKGSPAARSGERMNVTWGICGFGLGMIAGMFLLVAYAWLMVD